MVHPPNTKCVKSAEYMKTCPVNGKPLKVCPVTFKHGPVTVNNSKQS